MVDRSVVVRLRADVREFNRDIATSSAAVSTLESRLRAADREGGKSIDRLSGRISLLADLLLALGPAAIPLTAVAIPAVTTLASSLGFVTLSAGTAAVAFGGVGDALEKLNKAHLDPTEENLADAEKALKRLAPQAQAFIRQLDSMRELGGNLRDAGAAELFPGLTDALEILETRGPEAEAIIRALNGALGDIAEEGAASLASGRWGDFFHMLENEGPPVLDATADALGNVVHGLSEILAAFIPLNRDGLDWLVEMTEGFDEWATGLKKTEGFREFTDYVRENGPEVVETLGAIATAGVDIVTAAAPLGGPALNAIESFAEAVSLVADSDFATPLLAAVTAMRTINRLAPATAGSLSMLRGGAAAGAAAGAAGDKGGKPGKPGRGRGRGVSPGAGLGALIGADILAAELGWEEASDRQLERAEAFSEKWGKTWREAAEDARVKLSEVLDVATGSGPFGLKANDRGLTDALLTQPIERQIALQKQLRHEYGLGFKALENRGILLEGFTEEFKRQRDAVSPLAVDIERLGNMKASPKVDVDDRDARRKQREAEDWITQWGNKNAAAKADLEAQQAYTQFRLLGLRMDEVDDRVVSPTVDAETSAALAKIAAVRNAIESLRDRRLTITTVYDVVRNTNDALPYRGMAAGGTVPALAAGDTVPARRPYVPLTTA